ncbi:MAG: hypothetical protein NTX35_08705 [Verrucomicrobia bacterium]|nr:hypothetical protein [Verrucomicrobiota bacterium]
MLEPLVSSPHVLIEDEWEHKDEDELRARPAPAFPFDPTGDGR